MILRKIVDELNRIAPIHLAEPWDNVGLIAGDPAMEISRILLAIDYTASVSTEAGPGDCVVAYHPLLFKPVNRLTRDGPHGLVFDAIGRGIAIYSPHTALDVADGGTNDVLADAIGLVDRWPLRRADSLDSKTSQYKLVTFVPATAVDKVADAMTGAGAGRIGNYTRCTFRSPGVGTFEGGPGITPAVGRAGDFERVDEIRLETLVERADLEKVLAALKAVHPYETPAFDLLPLAAVPKSIGIGRVGRLPSPASALSVIDRLKSSLELSTVIVAGADRTIETVAICAGAGGDLLDHAIAAGADLFVTGELRHHDALKAAAAGMVVVCTLHSNSERPVLEAVKRRLESVPGMVPVVVSRTDRDPFRFA